MNTAAPTTVADVLSELYNVSDDFESSALDSLTVKAGFIWVCFCRWHNPTAATVCENCQRTRAQSDHDKQEEGF